MFFLQVIQIVQYTGLTFIALILLFIFYGVWRGARRPAGREVGAQPGLLRKPFFYLIASLIFFGLCWWLWKPLPVNLSQPVRAFGLVIGSLAFFPGLGLVLWGRLALGRQYFVSTSLGAQLYQDHVLITGGPYALVRHPMYLGLVVGCLGGIFVYWNWTFVFLGFGFLGLVFRAWREEQVLAAQFGADWQAYCTRVPAWVPFSILNKTNPRLHPGLAALLEVGILFLPAIPAYLFLWPYVGGEDGQIIQAAVYVYVIAGALYIGLRRWNWDALGLTRRGLRLSLAAGMLIVLARTLVILSVDWGQEAPSFSPFRLALEALYYFALVGFGEELMFRGVIYRALEDWRGVNWAIWGSSIGFSLWHIFGQGPLTGAAMVFYGLLFAMIRRRSGSITGLIFIHGLIDFSALLILPDIHAADLGRPEVPFPVLLFTGLALLVLVPLYLWLIHPHISSRTGWLASDHKP